MHGQIRGLLSTLVCRDQRVNHSGAQFISDWYDFGGLRGGVELEDVS